MSHKKKHSCMRIIEAIGNHLLRLRKVNILDITYDIQTNLEDVAVASATKALAKSVQKMDRFIECL